MEATDYEMFRILRLAEKPTKPVVVESSREVVSLTMRLNWSTGLNKTAQSSRIVWRHRAAAIRLNKTV
jgi:hypothetical protein